jgi:hypothetical protein
MLHVANDHRQQLVVNVKPETGKASVFVKSKRLNGP